MKILAPLTATAALVLLGSATATTPASAQQGAVNIYCSVQVEWCDAAATEFEKQTGIQVNMTQKGSGEVLAQIKAEAENPKGDVWFGGTGDPHLIAAAEGLTEVYESPNMGQLQEWALQQYGAAGGRSIGIYSGAIGFGYNTELLASKNLPAPACWADLLKPEYKGEIQMPNPSSSGTAYVIIATLVQLMGEDKAFEYLKALHPNVNTYQKSGTGPIKAVSRGETSVSISFVHDAVTEANAGFPVQYNVPCEGTGYEVGSMSIIAGGPNPDNAKKFYDWALTADAQRLGYDVGKQLQMPSNKDAPLPPNAPDLSKIKLIDYDFRTFGAEAARSHLIGRWESEVGSLPQ
jgi:iron(III) transport system substrate-binding protein